MNMNYILQHERIRSDWMSPNELLSAKKPSLLFMDKNSATKSVTMTSTIPNAANQIKFQINGDETYSAILGQYKANIQNIQNIPVDKMLGYTINTEHFNHQQLTYKYSQHFMTEDRTLACLDELEHEYRSQHYAVQDKTTISFLNKINKLNKLQQHKFVLAVFGMEYGEVSIKDLQSKSRETNIHKSVMSPQPPLNKVAPTSYQRDINYARNQPFKTQYPPMNIPNQQYPQVAQRPPPPTLSQQILPQQPQYRQQPPPNANKVKKPAKSKRGSSSVSGDTPSSRKRRMEQSPAFTQIPQPPPKVQRRSNNNRAIPRIYYFIIIRRYSITTTNNTIKTTKYSTTTKISSTNSTKYVFTIK